MSRRLLGLLVTKNERNRYLDECLDWQLGFLDSVFVYDDRSDDGTPEVAESCGAIVEVREEDDPSFLEHEGNFRQRSWDLFEQALQPVPGDWVLAFDADEFLVCVHDERATLDRISTSGAEAADIHVAEVFGKTADFGPAVRVDGYWNTIKHPRFFEYRPGGRFPNRVMGCGSAPSYVLSSIRTNVSDASILHYGYYRPEDRQAKYERYSQHFKSGHNNSHIESILKKPELARWTGKTPW